MKLLTVELRRQLPPLYSQENVEDPKVVAKFFTPDSIWTWYATEGGISETINEYVFFGLIDGHEIELGYFALSDLEKVRGGLGLRVERDLYFEPAPLSEVRAKVERARRA